jgi:hypothetical protein
MIMIMFICLRYAQEAVKTARQADSEREAAFRLTVQARRSAPGPAFRHPACTFCCERHEHDASVQGGLS